MNTIKLKKGITLLEILISLAVFSFVVAINASVFYRVFNDWTKQKTYLRAIEEAQWALEFMSNEIRTSSESSLKAPNQNGNGWKVGQRKGMKFDTPAENNVTYEWDGDNTLVRNFPGGNPAVLLRNGFATQDGRMYLPKSTPPPPPLQEASMFYNVDDGTKLTTVIITVRPNANQDAGPGNKEYTVRTTVFPRNP